MRREPGLKGYLIRSNFYLIMIPLIIIGVWGGIVINNMMRRVILQANELTVQAVADKLEEPFSRSREAINRIELTLIKTSLYPRERFNQYLADIITTLPFLDSIEILDLMGHILWLSPYDESFEGISRAGEELFENIIASPGIYWSSSYISMKYNQPALSFGKKTGMYVIQCNLNLDKIQDFADKLTGEYGSVFQIRVTDDSGTLIYHPDHAKVFEREIQPFFHLFKSRSRQVFSTTFSEGERQFLVSGIRMPEPGWFVLVLSPVEIAFASIRGFFLIIVPILLGSAVIGLIFSWIRAHHIIKPVVQLSESALNIGLGNFKELNDFGSGFSEFRQLGFNFNSMISTIKTREEILKDQERGFREILETIQLFAIGINTGELISFVNNFTCAVSGYDRKDLLSHSWKELILPPKDNVGNPGNSMEDFPVSRPFESELIRKQGDKRLVEWTGTQNYNAAGKISGLTLLGADITERKLQAQMLSASLAEKDVLMREIHHRVKNNLQLISSFLSLEAGAMNDARKGKPLFEAQNRIRSLSLIHENLYESSSMNDVDFNTYITQLSHELLSQVDNRGIHLKLDLAEVSLTIQEAIPCGLILNEALTNILKYAFPPEWEGERNVTITLAPNPGGIAKLAVADNGKGLSGEYNVEKPGTLGHTMIKLLTQQLSGSLSVVSSGGTRIEVAF